MSSSGPDKVQEKRGTFLDKVESEKAPVKAECGSDKSCDMGDGASKPRGAGFISSSTEPQCRPVDRKGPSCSSRGG